MFFYLPNKQLYVTETRGNGQNCRCPNFFLPETETETLWCMDADIVNRTWCGNISYPATFLLSKFSHEFAPNQKPGKMRESKICYPDTHSQFPWQRKGEGERES